MSCPEKDNSLNSGYMTCYTSFERCSQGEELLCITGERNLKFMKGNMKERERRWNQHILRGKVRKQSHCQQDC